jgi:hypothetical protein
MLDVPFDVRHPLTLTSMAMLIILTLECLDMAVGTTSSRHVHPEDMGPAKMMISLASLDMIIGLSELVVGT